MRVLNVDVPDGGSCFHPLNAGDSRVPLFSFYTDGYTISNNSDEEVAVDSIEIEHWEGVRDEEFTLRNCLLADEAEVIEDRVIEAGGQLEFDMCFVPVAGDLPAHVDQQYACEEDLDCGCLGRQRELPAHYLPWPVLLGRLVPGPARRDGHHQLQ